MTSNQRVILSFSGGSGVITYTITYNAAVIFTGRIFRTGAESVSVDITEIVLPFVSVPDIKLTNQSFTSLSATFSISATGVTTYTNSVTIDYLNDLVDTTLGSPSPTTWAEAVYGQPKFSYSSRTGYTVSTNTTGDCTKKRYALLWSNRWGLPESIAVNALVTAASTWSGVQGVRDYSSSQHRTRPLDGELQLSWALTTPIIAKGLRDSFVRSLGIAEKVYLYDIDKARLYPVVTPSVSDIAEKGSAFTINVNTAY